MYHRRASKVWVQVEGIEGDGCNGGDGDEDGKFRQFHKQHRALKPSLARFSSLLSFLG